MSEAKGRAFRKALPAGLSLTAQLDPVRLALTLSLGWWVEDVDVDVDLLYVVRLSEP